MGIEEIYPGKSWVSCFGDIVADDEFMNRVGGWDKLHEVRIEEASFVRDCVLHLRFSTGEDGEVDFEDALVGDGYDILRLPERFKKFSLDPESSDIFWENGYGLAAAHVYYAMTKQR